MLGELINDRVRNLVEAAALGRVIARVSQSVRLRCSVRTTLQPNWSAFHVRVENRVREGIKIEVIKSALAEKDR